MAKQGRLGDNAHCPSDSHGCPGCSHAVTGPAVKGSGNVNVNGMAALRVGDPGVHSSCCGPNKWVAAAGCGTVLINGKEAHRVDDATSHCGGRGTLIVGSDNVITGGGGSV